jgi:hypothetical protein
MISKTFSPNLPGSFTGGLIDVRTKDFPEKFNLTYGVSVGYNPNVNLNDQFMSSLTSGTDFLGFDSGYREVDAIVSDGKVPQVNFSNYYDAMVLGGLQNDLAALGMKSEGNLRITLHHGVSETEVRELIGAITSEASGVK